MDKPDEPGFAPPNWEHWGNLHTVELWQAVALSLDIAPEALDTIPGGFDPQRHSNLPPEFLPRLMVAANHMAAPTMQERYTPEWMRHVVLEQFGMWADNLPHPWEMPYEFPPVFNEETDDSTGSTGQESAHAANDQSGQRVQKRSRQDNLKRAIHAAWSSGLPVNSSASEVSDHLATKDDTGYIRGRDGDELAWENSRGAVTRTKLKALANRLVDYRKEWTPKS